MKVSKLKKFWSKSNCNKAPKRAVIIPDIFGWFNVKEVPAPFGAILVYDYELDHMFICDTLVDGRPFSHWQYLPRYPFGLEGEKECKITWSTGYCGRNYGKN